MASVVGLLEERELAERERVEVLREQADRILAELAEAETRWQEWVIARQRVDEVLSPAPSAPPPEAEPVGQAEVQEREPEVVTGPRAVGRGPSVPVRRPGSVPQALPAGYREIVRAVAEHAGPDGDSVMDCSQIAVALGMEPVKANTEGRVRHRAKRLVARGWLAEPVPGRFTLADGPDAGS